MDERRRYQDTRTEVSREEDEPMRDREGWESSGDDWEGACCALSVNESATLVPLLTYRADDQNQEHGKNMYRNIVGTSLPCRAACWFDRFDLILSALQFAPQDFERQ